MQELEKIDLREIKKSVFSIKDENNNQIIAEKVEIAKPLPRPTTTINFTKKAIFEIDPCSINSNYYDSVQQGLYLVVYPSGVKVFWTRKMINGRQKKFKIGNFPDISIENARKKVAEFRGKIAVGEDPTLLRYNFKKEKTFKEIFDEYIAKYAKQMKRTWQEDVVDVNQYFTGWFPRKACTITKEEVRSFHSKLGEKYPFRANRMIQKLSSIFNKKIEISTTNPQIIWQIPIKKWRTAKSKHLEEQKSAWKRILERAEIQNLRIHDICRTNSDYQVMTGSRLPIIGKFLGHKSTQSTEVYARMNNDPARKSFKCATADVLIYGKLVNKNTEDSSEK